MCGRIRMRAFCSLVFIAFAISAVLGLLPAPPAAAQSTNEPVGSQPVQDEAAAAVPVLANISPASGFIGITVHLYGSGFGAVRDSSYVSFGPFQSQSYSFWSDTAIACTVPELPGVPLPVTGPVTVTTAGGTSNAVSFTVTGVNPTISYVSPMWGLSSTVVDMYIEGTGFQPGAIVSLQRIMSPGYDAAIGIDVLSVSGTAITCRLRIPAWSRLSFAPDYMWPLYRVAVSNPDGGNTLYAGGTFAVWPNPCGAGAISPLLGFGLLFGTLGLAGGWKARKRNQ